MPTRRFSVMIGAISRNIRLKRTLGQVGVLFQALLLLEHQVQVRK
jgi:hypothetical protein